MAKGKKDIQVDEIKHPSGVAIPIMFNPNVPRHSGHENTGLTFSAAVADKVFRAKSVDEVRAQVREYLDDNSKLDWHPVIEITELAPFHSSHPDYFVGFVVDRFYLAEQKNGKRLRELRWDDYDPTEDNWMVKQAYDKIGNIDIARITQSKEFYTFHGKLPGCLPHRTNGHDKEIFVIAYDEKHWVALKQIQEGISRLKAKLRDLTGTPAGLKQLGVMGESMLKLLPAPDDKSAQ